ncbi:MAG: 2-amino-4-hydroxy-6-hydroxymethyldihydropteridine diphosphokinase [Bacteroidales bacterium]|nr:2-amino-4-hydroxy-6-hydroxymethyldihydropteridine diphosphokinase [Bacteroidales bacterium]
MHSVYLSLGSNLGNKIDYIFQAKIFIKSDIGLISKESALYLSEPWGYTSHNNFINQCVEVETFLEPLALLNKIKIIENLLGRGSHSKNFYTDRTIDIDILFYDNVCYKYKDIITIPHPLLHNRRFILLPLSEIALDYVHPLFNETVKNLLLKCKDNSIVTSLDQVNL